MRSVSAPAAMPSAVVGDRKLRARPGVTTAATQPHPRPDNHVTAPNAPATMAVALAATANRRRGRARIVQSTATYTAPAAAGTLTAAANVQSTSPTAGRPSAAIARPA